MNVADKMGDQNQVRRNSLLVFCGLAVSAFFMSYVPFVHLPFSWMQTYFHEISHGLAALLTGGSVISIELHLLGSGLCTTQGGIRFVVAFAGYLGAVLWGALIYTMVDNVSKKNATLLAGIMIALIIVSAALWGRDVVTLFIMGVMVVPFAVIMKTAQQTAVKYFLQFLGLYILLDAISSPLHLIDGRRYGDGHTLAELTGIPEMIWVGVWIAMGLGTLYFLWKNHLKRDPAIL